MKKVILFALAVVLALSVVPVMAASHTGKITILHYNTTIPGRGVCVRTSPEGPGTGWFCLWDTHLYKEINEVLRDAYFFDRTCSLNWGALDQHGHHLINLVHCQ